MRELAGLVALDAGMLAAGVALLAALRVAHGLLDALRYAGLALVVGWAATGTLLSLALAVGIHLSVATMIGIWAVVVAVAAGLWKLAPLPPWQPARVAAGREAGVMLLGRAGVAIGIVATAAHCWYPDGRLHPDVWNVWLPKAKIIYFSGGLTTVPGGFTSQISPDYPPLHTGMDAAAFAFMGGAHVLRLPLQSWILSLAFLAALLSLLRLRCPQHVAWLGVGLLSLMPSYTRVVGSGLADDPLAALFALVGVTAALWLVLRDPRLLGLSALFAAAAVMTKNEGSMLVVVTAAALALATRRLLPAAAFVAPAAVCTLVWRVWQHVHHVPRNFAYDFTKVADVPYLSHRTYRFAYGAAQVSKALASPGHWLFVPLALLLLAALVAGSLRVFALGTFALALLGYVVIYWISPVPIHAYIDSSSTRVVDTIALFAAALLPIVAAAASDT
jgi:hypothetical protein